jgi:outer membrane protein assembly factor BamB
MTDPVARDAPGIEAAGLLHTTQSCHVYAARLDGEQVRIVTPGPDARADVRAEVTARLEAWVSLGSHPSISAVHERGEEPRPWLAVTAAGTPLPEAAPLSVDAARSVVADVAEALREVSATDHAMPVEPADVRVSPAEQATTAQLDWPTRMDAASQSPYVPPEAADGEASGDRDSVFRLGALAYYAVTGQPPVAEGDDSTVHEKRWPSPSFVNSEVPAAFDAVVETALDPDPEERYNSPYEFKRALLFESQATPESGDRPAREHVATPAGSGANTARGGEADPGQEVGEHRDDIAGFGRRSVLGALGVGIVGTAGAGWFTATRLLDSETEEFPAFRYDAANTGHAPDAVGPTEGVTEAWTIDTETGVRASPVVADGAVFVNSFQGTTYALEVADGSERWSKQTGTMSYSSPAIGDGVVYLVDRSDRKPAIIASDLRDGAEQFRAGLPEMQPRTPVLSSGRLYVYGEQIVRALDTDGGTELWTTPGVSATGLSGAVSDGTLFVSGMTNRNPERETPWSERARGVIALDTADGSGRWVFDAEAGVSSSPAVADGVVYVGDSDNVLSAIGAADGERRWQFAANDTIASSPAVTDHQGGTVYVGSMDGFVYAVDRDGGEKRWQFETDGEVISSPAVVSDTVYVGSRDGNVYALDAEEGKERWRFETGGPVLSSPAVVSNTVFVGSDDGAIYALTEP